MPRSMWKGTLNFGLVSVPVKLYSAAVHKNVTFHQLHATDHARVVQRRFCSAEGEEVDYSEIVKGYELAPGRYVCLSVIDSGRGFDESVARRLFEPFFTTRLAGTGLGLATVHEIVRDHDGAMNVRSKPGEGSRFEVWLPTAAADSTAVVDPAMLPLGRGETVLVVEGEREWLLHDEEMLAALGYEPVGFERRVNLTMDLPAVQDRVGIPAQVCRRGRRWLRGT